MKEFIEFFKIVGPWASGILGAWVVINVIGEICELKGKVVPEFMKIRKYFKRRKEEKQKTKNLLANVESLLADVNSHYSADNIAKRDAWMAWVNSRAIVYDDAVADLKALHSSIEDNNRLTLDLYFELNRDRIINFASKINQSGVDVTREEFKRIFKIYKEYEDRLENLGLTNGEVDIAYRVIEEDYMNRLRNNNFFEDKRGWN